MRETSGEVAREKDGRAVKGRSIENIIDLLNAHGGFTHYYSSSPFP